MFKKPNVHTPMHSCKHAACSMQAIW